LLTDGSGLTVFAQPGYPVPGYGGHLLPFHFDTDPSQNGECTNDITHDWGPQHRSWNGGAMDGFLREHLADNGSANGPLTMGYYRRTDLPFYYALADAFTICDRFHCSVIGPTDPNRLYSMSGTLEPDVAANALPQVSWVLAPLVQSEHPPAPVTYGEYATYQVLNALTSNPQVWAKTALFVTYDENGGFFDHVPPPTAPPGTPGE